jgi:hypothetical protein
MNFISSCVAGIAKPEQIGDWVARWHRGEAGIDQNLADYLGLSQDEYAHWVADANALPAIVAAHAARAA